MANQLILKHTAPLDTHILFMGWLHFTICEEQAQDVEAFKNVLEFIYGVEVKVTNHNGITHVCLPKYDLSLELSSRTSEDSHELFEERMGFVYSKLPEALRKMIKGD